ncbi:rCG52346, isoform CRA_b [Rattus norvegicus]|uniref:RCG52346, isoform CRA_b n=1 Tax=Rattus norvegicus TaxID=10116 RepID=A6K128_RAT|nr:rCG52346, isoform CRA_b [Rattus norvegicus]
MGETMSKRLKFHLGEAEMEERSFPNPFLDYEVAASATGFASGTAEETGRVCPLPTTEDPGLPFHPNGKIVPNLIKRIQTKIKDLLQQMEEGLKTADPHDCSAYTGWTGIALLYLQLYRVTGDQTYLLRSLDYVKRTLRNLSGRRVTFLCGDAGPLAVGAVIYHKLKSECESQECITKLLQMHRTIVCQESELPDELLFGRAGYLYALLYLNTEIGPGTVGETAIKEVVTAIIESGKRLSREERKSERCPLLYQWHRKQYVGAAHGMAGIYYMLMQPEAKVDQETLTEMVKPSIDYVRHKKFRSGNYPSSLSNETDRLVHWCHGAPGVIHMLLRAYQVWLVLFTFFLTCWYQRQHGFRHLNLALCRRIKKVTTHVHFIGNIDFLPCIHYTYRCASCEAAVSSHEGKEKWHVNQATYGHFRVIRD